MITTLLSHTETTAQRYLWLNSRAVVKGIQIASLSFIYIQKASDQLRPLLIFRKGCFSSLFTFNAAPFNYVFLITNNSPLTPWSKVESEQPMYLVTEGLVRSNLLARIVKGRTNI